MSRSRVRVGLAIGVAALAILAAWLGVAFFRCRWTRPPPSTPLSQRELEILADQLDVRLVTAPTRMTVWFSDDSAVYSLNVRADFREEGPQRPFEAQWLAASNQVSLDDAASPDFLPPAPHFMAGTARLDLWQPLPTVFGDLVYRQPRRQLGPVHSIGLALVRKEGATVTLYLVQRGNAEEIGGILRDILTRGPVDTGWGPSQGSVFIRCWP